MSECKSNIVKVCADKRHIGTWQSKPGLVEKAVEVALKTGYRHVDTATAYGNEREVGEGIKNSGVPREEIFLTTKLNNTDHRKPLEALKYSLQQLETPYLDLCEHVSKRADFIFELINIVRADALARTCQR